MNIKKPKEGAHRIIYFYTFCASSNSMPSRERRKSPRRTRVSPAVTKSKQQSGPQLGTYHALKNHEIYHFIADNEFINTGYRYGHDFSDAFFSIFTLHNETINIWTHLLGAVWFISNFLFHLSSENISSISSLQIPKWPILIFLSSAIICLLGSTIYHTFHPVSDSVAKFLNKIDYVGIAILISGSSVPPIYYGFHCLHSLRFLYLFIVLIFAILATYLALSDTFRGPKYRFFRVTVYILDGAFGVLPLSHLIFFGKMNHDQELGTNISTLLILGHAVMGALYISGALLYAFRIPERFSNRFDIFFSSHQIFHVAVIAAAYVHYQTVISHYNWRLENDSCASFTH
jgi:adiponectin receptor